MVFSTVFTIGLVIGISFLCLNPALPCPNLGFTCETYLIFVTMGFMTCFSGCTFGSRLLPML